MRALSYLAMLVAASCFAAPTSDNNERLRNALKQNPAADANKDGVLTMREAVAYRAKQQGGAEQAGAEVTSENNKRLKQALRKYPKADTNKDGILSMAEARKWHAENGQGARTGGGKLPVLRTATGDAVTKGQEVTGTNGLYMGHSFFTPAARLLPRIIPDTNVVNHTTYSVMSGGQSGSPRMLWENQTKRDYGLKYLDKGDVDLFAMTYYSPADSSLEHYAKWFDYALKKNPKITFMVALPWAGELHKVPAEDLGEADQRMARLYQSLIEPLRAKYPKNKILFCPYGLGVYELARRHYAGELPGVKYVLNPDKATRNASQQKNEQLLKDNLGHGGDLVTHLNALVWLQTIYDYDVSTLPKQRVAGLPDVDLNEIAATVYKKIKHFNAVYQPGK